MDEEEYLIKYLHSYRLEDGYVHGYYEGDCQTFIDGYMAINSTKFVLKEHHQKGNKRYTKTESPFWEHKSGHIPIKFDGHPCQILKMGVYHCVHGPKQDARGSWKQSKHDEHDYTSNRSLKTRVARKMNCPATIQCRTVMVYKDYHVDSATCKNANCFRRAKERVMEELQRNLKEGATGSTSIRHYIRIALSSVHKYHPLGEAASMDQRVDKRIIHQIHEMVGRGVINTDEIIHRIVEFVDNELFRETPTDDRPKSNNRRYYPTKTDIRNHVSRAIATQRKQIMQEKDPQKNIKSSQPDDGVNSTNLKRTFQEKIKSLHDLSHLVDDVTVLTNAIASLNEVAIAMDKVCDKERGVPIRQSPTNLKLKPTDAAHHNIINAKLPQRKRYQKKQMNKCLTNTLAIDVTEDDDFQPITKQYRKDDTSSSSQTD